MKSFHAGGYVSQGWYNSYQPNPINRNWVIDDMEIVNLLSKADRVVGRLDMFSEYVPNIDLFIPNRSLGPISSGDVKVFSCSPESKECLPLIYGSHKT